MKKQILFTIILGIAISVGMFAQEKGLKDKLKKIEGKAESVVIKTDKGITTFSGEDADDLIKMLKSKQHAKKIVVIDGEDDFSWDEGNDVDIDELSLPIHKLKIFHDRGLDNDIRIDLSDMMDSLAPNKIHKKIVVQNKDGNKTVTVTTKENGTEKIEMFEGKDAEKYLEEHKSDTEKVDPSSKGLKKKVKKIVIEDEDQK